MSNKENDKFYEYWKHQIDNMSRIEMARFYRFAPAGHPVFDTSLPIYEYFQERFLRLGGMTPAISKAIGFEP